MKLEENSELVIKPKSQDKDSQRQEYILNVLLTGVLAVAIIALLLRPRHILFRLITIV